MIVGTRLGFCIGFLRLQWVAGSAYRAAQIDIMDLEIIDGP